MVLNHELTPTAGSRKVAWDEENLANNDLIKAELNTNPHVSCNNCDIVSIRRFTQLGRDSPVRRFCVLLTHSRLLGCMLDPMVACCRRMRSQRRHGRSYCPMTISICPFWIWMGMESQQKPLSKVMKVGGKKGRRRKLTCKRACTAM